jgi:hypothetical protein
MEWLWKMRSSKPRNVVLHERISKAVTTQEISLCSLSIIMYSYYKAMVEKQQNYILITVSKAVTTQEISLCSLSIIMYSYYKAMVEKQQNYILITLYMK